MLSGLVYTEWGHFLIKTSEEEEEEEKKKIVPRVLDFLYGPLRIVLKRQGI